ncbi:hypothetical protein GGX14DRAFT_365172 [Mycena pura]|uniref:Uncharacterized protein n=1 Tax=Mycena pura TaxID=153505 RepID=A0AAD6YC71_9AGAR|nr:hypothetical protein GGX14DRAFT_365172 [Mycena pura]
MEDIFLSVLTWRSGAYEIGVLGSCVLFGVLTAQCYVYFTRFPDDSAKIKALVGFVWLCETADAICITAALYSYTVMWYGDPESLLRTPSTLATSIFFHGVISCSVQGFFAFRIYIVSKKLYIPCVCWMLGFLRFLGDTGLFATGLRTTLLNSYYAQQGWLITATWSLSVANDVLIAVTLASLLYRQRSIAHTR